MNLGPTELIIILVIALIVLGPRKLPELGKTLGNAMSQFRRASDDFKRSWEQEVESEKARFTEIKQDIESVGRVDDYAGSDFNYSMDPNRGETDTDDPTTAADSDASPGQQATETETAAELSPEPANSTVARSEDSPKSERWI
jgi:Tat protein translocase TatB subunit